MWLRPLVAPSNNIIKAIAYTTDTSIFHFGRVRDMERSHGGRWEHRKFSHVFGDFISLLRRYTGRDGVSITSPTIVYSTVYSGTDQRKHQNSASLGFVRRIHRWPVNSPHKWSVTRKMFPFGDIIMSTVFYKCYLIMIWQTRILIHLIYDPKVNNMLAKRNWHLHDKYVYFFVAWQLIIIGVIQKRYRNVNYQKRCSILVPSSSKWRIFWKGWYYSKGKFVLKSYLRVRWMWALYIYIYMYIYTYICIYIYLTQQQNMCKKVQMWRRC